MTIEQCAKSTQAEVSIFDESDIFCPYCGEPNTVFFDGSEGEQITVTDCTVCCRPIRLAIRTESGDDSDQPVYSVVATRE